MSDSSKSIIDETNWNWDSFLWGVGLSWKQVQRYFYYQKIILEGNLLLESMLNSSILLLKKLFRLNENIESAEFIK